MGGRPVACPIVALNVWEEDGGFEGGGGDSAWPREKGSPPLLPGTLPRCQSKSWGGMIYI